MSSPAVLRRLAAVALVLAIAACATPEPEPPVVTPPEVVEEVPPEPTYGLPRVVDDAQDWECVVYARSIGAVQLTGNAWTWWDQAEGVYDRGQVPQVGAVLVMKRKGNSLGHVAVVRAIVDSRQIVAEHANWLNRGEVQIDSRIQDVSPNNDWTAVRVWYVPGHSWGRTTYPAYGFIYPVEVASLP